MKKIGIFLIITWICIDSTGQTADQYFNQAVAACRNKNYTEAKNLFTRAIIIDPTLTEAWYNYNYTFYFKDLDANARNQIGNTFFDVNISDIIFDMHSLDGTLTVLTQEE